MSPYSVMALCLVALAAVQPGSALRCWSCNSQNDYSCDDPFRGTNQFALVECDSRAAPGQFYTGYPVCKKLRLRVDGRPLVERSCGWVDPNDGGRSACYQRQTPGYIHQEYCSICSTDACNSAPRPASLAAPLLVPFAAPLAVVAAWLRR